MLEAGVGCPLEARGRVEIHYRYLGAGMGCPKMLGAGAGYCTALSHSFIIPSLKFSKIKYFGKISLFDMYSIHTCVLMSACGDMVCVGACTRGGPSLLSRIIFHCLSTLVNEPRYPDQSHGSLIWLASLLWGPHLYLLSIELQKATMPTLLYCGFWGSKF